MKLPETGWTRDQIFTALAELRAGDLPTEGGAAFAYVYDSGERAASELAAEAYRMYLGSNGLDPTAFPSLLRLENEVVGFAAQHLGGGPEAAGSFTSGGTESLMLAVKTAREWARVHRPNITKPEIVVPATAHAALHKAAHYLDVTLVPTAIDPHVLPRRQRVHRRGLSQDAGAAVRARRHGPRRRRPGRPRRLRAHADLRRPGRQVRVAHPAAA